MWCDIEDQTDVVRVCPCGGGDGEMDGMRGCPGGIEGVESGREDRVEETRCVDRIIGIGKVLFKATAVVYAKIEYAAVHDTAWCPECL